MSALLAEERPRAGDGRPPARALADRGRAVAVLILAAAVATIGGAYVFQHGLGYVPCKLCLLQRQPYYAAMPLALATALAPAAGPGALPWRRIGFGLLALVFAASLGLGLYHAGVEWRWWPGPADCGGGSPASSANVADFVKALNGVKVVSCTEAAWRFAGLSLAGWNAVISAGLAGLAGRASLRAR